MRRQRPLVPERVFQLGVAVTPEHVRERRRDPGAGGDSLRPTETFDGEPLYRVGDEPDATEIAQRRGAFFDLHHTRPRGEIDRTRAAHPRVVLYDCHSIRSVMPRLFDGVLPLYNLGTNGGASADAQLTDGVENVLAARG